MSETEKIKKNLAKADQILWFVPLILAIVFGLMAGFFYRFGTDTTSFFGGVIGFLDFPLGIFYLTVLFAGLLQLYGQRKIRGFAWYLVSVIIWRLIPLTFVLPETIKSSLYLDGVLFSLQSILFYLFIALFVFLIVTPLFRFLVLPEIKKQGFERIAQRDLWLLLLPFSLSAFSVFFLFMIDPGDLLFVSWGGVLCVVVGLVSGIFGRLPKSMSAIATLSIVQVVAVLSLFGYFAATVGSMPTTLLIPLGLLLFFVPFIGARIGRTIRGNRNEGRSEQ